jgi:hypothetical protein
VIHDLPADWNKDVLRRARNVTVDEIKKIMSAMILPCFEPGKSNIVITCGESMVEVCVRSQAGLVGGVLTFACLGFGNSFHGNRIQGSGPRTEPFPR